jgi:integrase
MPKTSNKLTAKTLSQLALEETAYGSNLRATRNKSGDITFYANFTISGNRFQKRLGTNANLNLTEAVKLASQFKAKAERENELLGSDTAKATMTFLEAMPIYMDYEMKNYGKNIVEKEQHFRLHIIPELGDRKINSFTSKIAKEFQNVLRGKGLKDGTIKRVFATLGSFYSHAVGEEWVRMKTYKIEIKDETVMRRDKIPEHHKLALFAAAKKPEQHPMIFLFLLIGFEVGMRHREILTLRFENINYDTAKVWLPTSKVGSRWQPLTQLILQELKDLQERRKVDAGYVFKSDTAKTGHINRMNHAFTRLCKSAGLPNYTPHNMRHSCVSELVELGFNDRQVSSYTGHKTAAMISWYAKPEITAKQADAMKARGESLIAALGS